MKELRCADAGLGADCDGLVRGRDQREVLEKLEQHVVASHGGERLSAEVVERARAAIRDVPGEAEAVPAAASEADEPGPQEKLEVRERGREPATGPLTPPGEDAP